MCGNEYNGTFNSKEELGIYLTCKKCSDVSKQYGSVERKVQRTVREFEVKNSCRSEKPRKRFICSEVWMYSLVKFCGLVCIILMLDYGLVTPACAQGNVTIFLP